MKKLIIAAMLLTSTTFAQSLPQPECRQQPDGRIVLHFQSLGHVFADFCIYGKGLKSPEACRAYQDAQGREKILQELNEYMREKTKRLCGE